MLLAILFSWLALSVVAIELPPEHDSGTFIQRKHLHDVGITLVSSGTWSFDRDVAFVWHTLKPVDSVFVATPTNWSYTAAGRTTSRSTRVKISSPDEVFKVKEMAEFVEKVEHSGNPPQEVKVMFKNGDKLDISLIREKEIK